MIIYYEEIDMNAEMWTIIGSDIAIIVAIYTFLRNFKQDINFHIDRLENRMKEDGEKRDKKFSEMDQRILESNKRMDGVYHILLKRTENLK